MSLFHNNILAGASGGSGPTYVDDVFSTDLWTGNTGTQTITNGIDLSGEGGMVWIKGRNDTWTHALFDTERGPGFELDSSQDYGHDSDTQVSSQKDLYQFNSNGYSIGQNYNSYINANGDTFVGWTFRECPGFFDIVTYTGNGTSGRTIAHNLGSVPGCIMVKRTSDSADWAVYHRANEGFFASDPVSNLHLHLNQNHTAQGSSAYWNDTDPTSTVFTVGNSNDVNQNGETYVAYLFAHDDQSFGDDSDEAIIKCGSYTGTGSLLDVNLGFEPQWLLIKKTQTSTATWVMWDTMRGFTVSGIDDKFLKANESSAEGTYSSVGITATGFQVESGDSNTNSSGDNVIYIAIRRPHKPPSAGSEVYGAADYTGAGSAAVTFDLGITVDTYLQFSADTNYDFKHFGARLLGLKGIYTVSGSAEFTSKYDFDVQTGLNMTSGTENTANNSGTAYRLRGFKRAAKFHDVVAYAGDNTNPRSITHNLGVAPELIILKQRGGDSWAVYSAVTGSSKEHWLNNQTNSGFFTGNSIWTGTDPTASVFYVKKDGQVNQSGDNYIAWLWASLSGVSKVGSYTGTGSNIDVDCGFTAGARFLLIRRTDAAGNYYVFDSERGIVSGNDPFIELDTSDSEVTNTDYIDPLNAGFTVTSSAPAGLNASGGTYLFLAVA